MTKESEERIWDEIRSLAPLIRETRDEAERLRRLPDAVAQAFVDHDLYRLLLPRDLGGRGLDPMLQFDLTEEIAFYDGSVGWNFAIGTSGASLAGVLPPHLIARIFGSPDQAVAASAAVQGKAVAVEGGYRVSGRFAWASGIHQASWVVAGCFVFDGETQRLDQTGMPIVRHAVVPKSDVTVLDTWHVGGLRGTGSTEFELRDLFVPEELMVIIFGEPRHPAPFFRLPTSFFGFALSGVALGIARSSVTALKDLAARKKSTPPRLGLGDKANTHYVVAKAEAMVEAGQAGVREAFTRMWHHIIEDGAAPMESRARLKRAIVHAAESSVAAVDLCFHTAGGTALFENEPFERALRDVHAVSGHLGLQREMMEDAGRVVLGMKPMLAIF